MSKLNKAQIASLASLMHNVGQALLIAGLLAGLLQHASYVPILKAIAGAALFIVGGLALQREVDHGDNH